MVKLLNLIKIGGIALLVILLAVYVFRSCNLVDENSKLRGIIEVKDSLLKQQEERTALAKEAYEKALKEQGAEVLHWQEIADKNAGGIATGNLKIKDLKEQLAKLNPAEKDAIILTQKALITTLENNLTLAYETIEAKDKIIASWEVKFVKWEGYRVELETENVQLHGLDDSQKALISGLEKDLRWARLTGRTKNILIVGAAAYVIYGILVKK